MNKENPYDHLMWELLCRHPERMPRKYEFSPESPAEILERLRALFWRPKPTKRADGIEDLRFDAQMFEWFIRHCRLEEDAIYHIGPSIRGVAAVFARRFAAKEYGDAKIETILPLIDSYQKRFTRGYQTFLKALVFEVFHPQRYPVFLYRKGEWIIAKSGSEFSGSDAIQWVQTLVPKKMFRGRAPLASPFDEKDRYAELHHQQPPPSSCYEIYVDLLWRRAVAVVQRAIEKQYYDHDEDAALMHAIKQDLQSFEAKNADCSPGERNIAAELLYNRYGYRPDELRKQLLGQKSNGDFVQLPEDAPEMGQE